MFKFRHFWVTHKDSIFRFIEVLCYLIIGVAICSSISIFVWEREIHFREQGYIADADILGNFGDFISGSVGCVIAVVSMYLLFRTLKSQRAATISNNQLMTVQRFNDLFFRLIELYRQLSNDLVIAKDNNLCLDGRTPFYNDTERRDKDFFDIWRSVIERSCQTVATFEGINQQTLKYYISFYNRNKNKLGAYFRTIYRIVELINLSNISNEEKRNYSKILRAQLSESELFMLFYNSQTDFGQKFGKYLWEYHILKHLPVYETVEFKKLYNNLKDNEKGELDSIYSLLLSTTKDIVREYNGKAINKTKSYKHFFFDFVCNPYKQNSNTCQVTLSVITNNSDIYCNEPNLRQYTHKEWSELFNNMLSLINLFSKHTKFSCQSRYITHKPPSHFFIFTFISFKGPELFHKHEAI